MANFVDPSKMWLEYCTSINIYNECEKQDKFSSAASCTNGLALIFIEMAKKYSLRANFRNYSFVEEMTADGVIVLLSAYSKFDINYVEKRWANTINPRSSKDAFFGKALFSYLTTALTRAYIFRIKSEKKQFNIKDIMRAENGMDINNRVTHEDFKHA